MVETLKGVVRRSTKFFGDRDNYKKIIVIVIVWKLEWRNRNEKDEPNAFN